VDPELFDVITRAMTYGSESGGAFDVTVGPLMKVWGFFDGDARVPTPSELARVRTRVGQRHVTLDPQRHTVRFDHHGVELDLGGIAKGYAVDRIVDLLTARGIRSALVDAGGSTMFALGAPPGSSAWDVRVEDPRERGKVAFTVPLRDRALSVSGSSERFFEAHGVRYSHIMDPRTGRPAQGVLSVVVLAASGTAGDAIGTTLFVLGAARGPALLRRHPGTEAFFLLPTEGTSWTMVHLGE